MPYQFQLNVFSNSSLSLSQSDISLSLSQSEPEANRKARRNSNRFCCQSEAEGSYKDNRKVKFSLEAAKLARSNASHGIYDASALSSRQAISFAEDAFFHSSMMSVSYYSFEHCFSVYTVRPTIPKEDNM